MKTRIMILACLLAVPAGRMAAQQQTDLEQKATVQTQGDSIIILKGKGDCASRCTKSSWKTARKKKCKFMKESISRRWMQTSVLSSMPCHSSPKREGTMLTNRTVPVCILATAGWLTTSSPSEQVTRWDSTCPNHGNSASTSSPYITTQEEPALGNQPGSQLGIPFFQYRR